jgi:hypothetical protein
MLWLGSDDGFRVEVQDGVCVLWGVQQRNVEKGHEVLYSMGPCIRVMRYVHPSYILKI